MNRARYTPSSLSVYNSLWQNVLLLAAWGTATEIWHIAQKLLVQQAQSWVIKVCCRINPLVCNPAWFQQWRFISCRDFPVTSELAMKSQVFLSMYVIAVKESGQALQKLGVSSHGVALHPEPFAVCTVFGIKISCGAYLQIICVMAMYLRMKELVSQIHRWTLLRLQSNWVQEQVPKALPFRSPALRIFGLHPLCQCWHRCVSKLLVFWGAVNTCPGGLDWDLTCPVCIILAKCPQMALTQLDSSYLFLTCD